MKREATTPRAPVEEVQCETTYEQRFDVELPVEVYRDLITQTVDSQQVTIISAATGAGKSTRVPRFLYDTGRYHKQFMTQPRIMAARNVCDRVASEMTNDGIEDATDIVGYQTAHEGNATDETRINVMTDGLLLMKMLEEGQVTQDDIVVIDEFHERNKNMDIALALCIEKGIKTVIMSATLDIDRLVEHCEKNCGAENVSLIEVPGKVYDIEEHTDEEDRARDMSETVFDAALRGENVLAFVPGRREAGVLERKIRARYNRNRIYPPVILYLNGDQTPEEQQRSIDSYPGGKIIISTPVGQTSITIPDIDTVIDCGWERAGKYEDGVHSVPVQPSSQATMDQRRGRVGRTKPGKYFQARLDEGPPFPDPDSDGFLNYDIPDILRTDTLEVTLRLAQAGFTLTKLDGLLDKPPVYESERVQRRLVRLGALAIDSANGDYRLTDEGDEMIRYPVDAAYSRMIVEAAKVSPELQLQMIAGVSAMQVNGIVTTSADQDNWRKLSNNENRSDVLVQMKVLAEAMKMTEQEREKFDIVEQRYRKAYKYFDSIARRAGLDPLELTQPTEAQCEQIVDAIIVGSEEIAIRHGDKYQGARGSARRPSRGSVVFAHNAPLVVGKPLNLGKLDKKGPGIDRLLVNITAVDLERLVRVLPEHRVGREVRGYDVNKNGQIVSRDEIIIDGRAMPKTLPGPVTMMNPDAVRRGLEEVFETFRSVEDMKLADEIDQAMVRDLRRTLEELVELQHQTDEDLQIEERIAEAIESICSQYEMYEGVADMSSIAKLVPNVMQVAALVGEQKRAEIRKAAAGAIYIGESEHEVTYHNNIAHLDIPVSVILTLESSEQHDSIIAALNGREVRMRASDMPSNSQKYRPIAEAVEYYGRLSRSDRRPPVAPPTVDPEVAQQEEDAKLAAAEAHRKEALRRKRHQRKG